MSGASARHASSTASLWEGDDPPASEYAILALVDAFFPSRTSYTPAGRGHDCAELALEDGVLALSTDMFWQETHFRTSYFTPQEVGAKALSSAVSDLAAAGAVPLGFSLGLLLPRQFSLRPLSGLLEGMAEKARQFGMILTGGDLAQGDVLGLCVTVWGKAPGRNISFLRRGQAQAGDCVFLIGEAGLARCGLWLLEERGRNALACWPKSCRALLAPQPLLREGQAVARLAHTCAYGHAPDQAYFSLMDLSDGLARDLPRLLAGAGCDLNFDDSLISREVRDAAKLMGHSPESVFLLGGEDYALIGTCPENYWTLLQNSVPEARLLGIVNSGTDICRQGKPLALRGFDHFAPPFREDSPKWDSGLLLQAAQTIIDAGEEAWQAGLMAGFNGNISCRIPQTPATGKISVSAEVCLITGSGMAKGRLSPEDLVLLTIPGGEILSGRSASSESFLHLGVYAACPASRAVLHTHPPHLLALSLALPPEKRLNLPLPEAERYRNFLVQIPFFPPGSRELAEAVAQAAKTRAAIWMERHGLVVHGADLPFVLSLTEELEQLAQVHLSSLV